MTTKTTKKKSNRNHTTVVVFLEKGKDEKGESINVLSRVTASVQLKTGLPLAKKDQFTNAKKNLIRGTKGAGSMKIVYSSTTNKSKRETYSVPVPAGFHVSHMIHVAHSCKGNPIAVITPNGRSYPVAQDVAET